MAWWAALDSVRVRTLLYTFVTLALLTEDKTGVTLDAGQDLGLLDGPGADVRERLVADGRLLRGARDGPARVGDLLLELLDEGGLDGGRLQDVSAHSISRAAWF